MRALILHANKFQVRVVEESSRPHGIEPEKITSTEEEMPQCLVAFFCVEKGDTEKQLKELETEIASCAKDFDTKNIMVAPFVHLSNNIAPPELAKNYYETLLANLKKTDFIVKRSHFGYHKSLLLDVKGHPGSFRYREF